MRLLCDFLPDAILSKSGTDRLLTCAQTLPMMSVQSAFGVESPLGIAHPHCDFFVSVVSGSPYAARLSLDSDSQTAPRWTRTLGEFFNSDLGTDPPQEIPPHRAILEYDLADGDVTSALRPAIFLETAGLTSGPYFGHHTKDIEGVTDTLCDLADWNIDQTLRAATTQMFRSAPQSARCTYMGVFPGRQTRAVRCIFRIPIEEIESFAVGTGWRGPRARLSTLLSTLCSMNSEVATCVAIDVSPNGLLPRLGIEVYSGRHWYNFPPGAWAPLVDHLVDLGWCTPQKGLAIKSWPRFDLVFSDHSAKRLLSGVNHFKLTLTDEESHAKAYFALHLLNLVTSTSTSSRL